MVGNMTLGKLLTDSEIKSIYGIRTVHPFRSMQLLYKQKAFKVDLNTTLRDAAAKRNM